MKRLSLLFGAFLLSGALFSQALQVSFSFTAHYECAYAPLDSVVIENISHPGDTTLHWDDTVITFDFTSVNYPQGDDGIYLSKGYPNPFEDQVHFDLHIDDGRVPVVLSVYDLSGRRLADYSSALSRGAHRFSFSSGASGVYLLSLEAWGVRYHQKVVRVGDPGNERPVLEYEGMLPELKKGEGPSPVKNRGAFTYSVGDTLSFTGYVSGSMDVITDSPYGDEDYFFDIACDTAFVCGDIFTDSRDGNQYATVQIGNQCWLAENLKYLPQVHDDASFASAGNSQQAAYGVNGYDGNDVSVALTHANYGTYGVHYNWWAAMDGSSSSHTNPSGVQGVCPAGWHLPSDDEWKDLEVEVGMSVAEANSSGWRGSNQGSKLAGNSSLWESGPLVNNASFGDSNFDALPAGVRDEQGVFSAPETSAGFWTATQADGVHGWQRMIFRHFAYILRDDNSSKKNGYSVRCVKD